MKIVKKTISLPQDVFQFATQEAARKAKESGSVPNLSAYIREVLLKQQRDGMQLKKAA